MTQGIKFKKLYDNTFKILQAKKCESILNTLFSYKN